MPPCCCGSQWRAGREGTQKGQREGKTRWATITRQCLAGMSAASLGSATHLCCCGGWGLGLASFLGLRSMAGAAPVARQRDKRKKRPRKKKRTNQRTARHPAHAMASVYRQIKFDDGAKYKVPAPVLQSVALPVRRSSRRGPVGGGRPVCVARIQRCLHARLTVCVCVCVRLSLCVCHCVPVSLCAGLHAGRQATRDWRVHSA
jgi:hypothetical protein